MNRKMAAEEFVKLIRLKHPSKCINCDADLTYVNILQKYCSMDCFKLFFKKYLKALKNE